MSAVGQQCRYPHTRKTNEHTKMRLLNCTYVVRSILLDTHKSAKLLWVEVGEKLNGVLGGGLNFSVGQDVGRTWEKPHQRQYPSVQSPCWWTDHIGYMPWMFRCSPSKCSGDL
jgi:hypothetical protein